MTTLARILVVTSVFLACGQREDASQQPAEPSADSPPAVVGWAAQVSTLTGTPQVLEGRKAGTAGFSPLAVGDRLSPGSHVRTGPATTALLEFAEGRVWLNHSTEVHLPDDSPGLSIVAGQMVIEHRGEGQGPAPRVVTPTGAVTLTGTKLVVLADERESSVVISQGGVAVAGGTGELHAYAGEEVRLPHSGAARILSAVDLGESFGWVEREAATGTEVQVSRGLGKLVGKSPGGERERPLELSRHKVSVRIQGNVAYTEITEVFANPTGETLEGLYRFPLPGDAQISRLALKVGDRMMEGEFLETRRAERIWRTIIDQWRDPAMLKWKHGNQFELRIFPIEPRSSRLITIGYTQKLRPTGDGYRYVYPMPRDDTGMARAGRFEFEAEVHGEHGTPNVQVMGYPASVSSLADGETGAGQTKVSYRQDDFWARGDLALRFAHAKPRELTTWAYQGREADGFVAFSLRPRLPRSVDNHGRDFVLVLDTSYSRHGLAMALQQALAPRLVAEMDPLDRVVVIACATTCAPVGQAGFAPAREATAAAVSADVAKLSARGSSYTLEAVRVAAELLRRRDDQRRQAHIIYLTDGISSAGELRPGQLTTAVADTLAASRARLGLVDLGGDTDEAVLEALARGGRGAVIRLDPAMSLTGHALRILGYHYGAVLANPSVQLPAGLERVHPVSFGSLAAGEELTVVARVNGRIQGSVALTGTLGGQPFETSWPVDVAPADHAGNGFVPRLWASLAIRDLELDAGANRKEIVRLSKRYGVLSRFTTLLALESREMMKEFNVGRRKRDDWRGRNAPTESSTEDAGGDRSAPVAKTASKRSKPKKKLSRSFDDDLDVLLGGGGGGGWGRSHGRRWRREVVHKLRAPEVYPTTWEQKNAERRREQFLAETDNRSKRMRSIRAHLRAGQPDAALAETRRWLQINPFDPEAVVQEAQILAYNGQAADALQRLESALDAAPRGRWLQERVRLAYQANGNDALACAHAVANQALAKKPAKDAPKNLACPLATDMANWFGAAPLERLSEPAGELKGKLRVAITWEGAGDIDIQLIEPSGRVLSWLSQRQRLHVSGVRGGNAEQLALPSLRNGTYKVRLVRVSGDASLQVQGTVFLGRKKLQIDVSVADEPVFVAEAVQSTGW